MDEGGKYMPSALQRKVWRMWEIFWDEWVPHVTKGEPYGVVLNGDALDGTHHGSTHQISHNLNDQSRIAYEILKKVVDHARGGYYHIRGTEAHVGPSGVEEERLATALGATPNAESQRARYDLWLRVGSGLVHLSHHIGTAGSMAYESSAVMRELSEAYVEAGRWRDEPADVIIRSHRHRHIEVRIPTVKGFAVGCTSPAWQLKTPFAFRVAGARQSTPQIGGMVVRSGDEELYTRHRVWTIGRSREERLRIR